MHTVELLEQAIALAGRCGFVVRQDWFGGSAAGVCEFQGRRWIFIDLALTHREQLDQVLAGLQSLPSLAQDKVPPQLHTMLNLHKAA
jgi:hypothetical protein